MPMTRREFFRTGLALAGSALLPRSGFAAEGSADALPDGLPDVAHVAGGAPEDAVRAAVDAVGGISAFVKPGQSVLIKPNVGFPNAPEAVTTTDPVVVAAVAALCKEARAGSIVIADYPVRNTEMCFDESGIGGLGRIGGVDVMPLSGNSAFATTAIPNAVEVQEVDYAQVALQADVIIAVPVAKSHSGAGVTFALKGMMGLIQARGAFHRQYDLHQAVADLAKLAKPDLVVTDARRALVTGGPGGPGRVETPGAILAGANATTVDAYTVGMAEWYNRAVTADKVRHLVLANQQGLGEIDVALMNVANIRL